MTESDVPLIAIFRRLLTPFAIIFTLYCSAWIFDESFDGYYLVLAVITFFISAGVYEQLNLFRSWRVARTPSRIRSIITGWAAVVAGLLLIGYASGLAYRFSSQVILLWFSITPVALTLLHFLLYRLVITKHNRHQVREIVIVGANEIGNRLARQINSDPYLFMEVKGFFDDRAQDRLGITVDGKMLGVINELPNYARANHTDIIYIALPMTAQPRIRQLLEDLKDTTASIYFVPDIYIFDLVQARFGNISGVPVVAICETPFTGVNSAIKRAEDIVLSSLILLLISPLLIIIAAAVKLTSRGPVIFRQRRYGLNGEKIIVYKFRSMTVCEDGPDIPQARKNDRRLTRLGRFLRRTSLDELPQFVNVLQGRMSIVGPRPHAVAHNELYRKLIKGYMLRHKVKPGITGWAQVNGLRGETESLEKMTARIEHDIDYLRHWSVSLDLWIILRTIWVVLRGDGAY